MRRVPSVQMFTLFLLALLSSLRTIPLLSDYYGSNSLRFAPALEVARFRFFVFFFFFFPLVQNFACSIAAQAR